MYGHLLSIVRYLGEVFSRIHHHPISSPRWRFSSNVQCFIWSGNFEFAGNLAIRTAIMKENGLTV